MRGRGNSYPPHGRHINDAFPGLWPLRFRRSQLKLRRQQFWCCQLFFNCPFYGGQAPPPAYPASTPPSKPVRPRIFALEKPEVFREWGCGLPPAGDKLCEAFCLTKLYFLPRAGKSTGTQAEYGFTARRDPAAYPAPDTPRPWCPR